MQRVWIPAIVLGAALSAGAATVDFTSTLNGANERPTPTNSTATGTATGQLTGDTGAWVFTYHIEYSGLTGPATVGHIHDAINPGGQPFTEQFGPPVHDLDSLTSPIDGDWRFDDATLPLTDEFAGKLQAGALYVNIHSDQFPNGEIRGQLLAVNEPQPPQPPSGIPLPPGVWTGLMGMAGSGLAVWRVRRRASA
jgi:hypothetical protein